MLDKWERQALADRQGLIARGVVEDLPSLADVQVRFDEALAAEPRRLTVVDTEQMELLAALGVA